MRKIEKYLVGQAIGLPIIWLIPIIIGISVEGYSSLRMHISELPLANLSATQQTFDIASVFLVGCSSLTFAIGLIIAKRQITFTGLVATLYSIGMISNAIFPTGSALHGMYGLPIFSIVLPVFFAIEFCSEVPTGNSRFIKYCMLTALLNLVYLWIMLFGLDPIEYRGLTQRVAIYVLNIWFAVAAFVFIKRAYPRRVDTSSP